MPSSTVENYLKQLYLERGTPSGRMVPMGRLANAMGVVPGTATSMVKGLSDAGLVRYEPRGGVSLTVKGERLALHVLRRHRLIELFLVQVLGLDWSVVHEEAERLEHSISDRVLERMDAFLGHPTEDPHGDPIPTSQGHVHEPQRLSLADCATGVPLRVARILDQGSEFLTFVERHGLAPGASVIVQQGEAAAQAISIQSGQRKPISLGIVAAAKILVEPLARERDRKADRKSAQPQ